MWVRNGIGVSSCRVPAPSRARSTVIWVSLVLRSTRACRRATTFSSTSPSASGIRYLSPQLTEPFSRRLDLGRRLRADDIEARSLFLTGLRVTRPHLQDPRRIEMERHLDRGL